MTGGICTMMYDHKRPETDWSCTYPQGEVAPPDVTQGSRGLVPGARTHGYNYLETRASGGALQREVGGLRSVRRPLERGDPGILRKAKTESRHRLGR